MVVVGVRDDGKGYTAQDGASGLRNMRDRARDVGGACDIRSTPGEGTTVRWNSPLHGREIA